MRSSRKHWWTALSAAALLAGCSGETADTATPATTPTTTPTPAPEPKVETRPELTPAVPKADADKDMPKADDASKTDMPKVEGPKIDAPKVEPPKADADKKAAADKLDADEIAAIKKLPADEQAAALAQMVCPVSGGHLGSEGMGMPVKVSAEGKTFYLCCKNCKPEVDKDPKAVVAKLAGK